MAKETANPSNSPESLNSNSVFSRYEIIFITCCVLTTIVLGMLGLHAYYQETEQHATLLDIAYQTIALFLFEFQDIEGEIPIPLEIARWLAPISLSYAAIKTLTVILGEKMAHARIQRLSRHAIVFGLNHRSLATIQSLLKAQIKTLVISNNNQHALAGWAKKYGAYVIEDFSENIPPLLDKHVLKAQYLLAATDNDNTNTEIIYHAFKQCEQHTSDSTLYCAVEIHNPNLATTLYDHCIFSTDYPHYSARIINYNTISARVLLNTHGPEREIPSLSKEKNDLNILVIGNNDFIDHIILRIATIGHYGNQHPVNVCIAGKSARQRMTKLIQTNTILPELLNLQAQDADLSILNITMSKQLIDDFSPDIIYLYCDNIESAMIWSQTLYTLNVKVPSICISPSKIALNIVEDDENKHHNMKFFDLYENSSDHENIFNAKQDQLAKAIHNNYIKNQMDLGQSVETNPSLVPWDKLPETLKDANRNQADHMEIKCRLLTDTPEYSIDDIKNKLNSTTKILNVWLKLNMTAGMQKNYSQDGDIPMEKRILIYVYHQA